MAFSDEVKKWGSVSAAMEATGHRKGEDGKWRKDPNAPRKEYNPTPHANDSDTHRAMNEAAKAGDWDKVGSLGNNLIENKNNGLYSTGDMTHANEYIHELQNAYGYNANDYYRGKYDAIYGEGAWDRPEPSHTPVNGADNGMIGGSVSGSIGGIGGPGGTPAPGSAEAYLRDLYGSKIDAETAGLKAAFDRNVSALDEQGETLKDNYDAKLHIAEGENDLQRMRMNELFTAQGLNTGATGQMALGQSQAYQNMVGGLAAQLERDQAALERQKSDLRVSYENAIAQANAAGNAQLAEALYQEYIRQQGNVEAERNRAYKESLAKAEFLASQGDMSGYEALGWIPKGGFQTAPANPGTNPGGGGGWFDNGGIDPETIKAMQEYFGVTPDGMWGNNSKSTTGMNATDAYAAWLAAGGKTPQQPRLWADPNISNEMKLMLIENAVRSGQLSETVGEAYLASMGY